MCHMGLVNLNFNALAKIEREYLEEYSYFIT